MGYKTNVVSNRPVSAVKRRLLGRVEEPFKKGYFGSLDFRLYPGTEGWNKYEATGVQAEDVPHLACFAEHLAEYFEKPSYATFKLFEEELPQWVFDPQMIIAKWVFPTVPMPVKEGEIEGFEKRLAAFIKRNKLPDTLKPCVIHFEIPDLKAMFHGYCPDEKVVIHIDSEKAPKDDQNYWVWQMTLMAYKMAMMEMSGFDVNRVVFGDIRLSRDISGERLDLMRKLGRGLLSMVADCYEEFVILEEQPPLVTAF